MLELKVIIASTRPGRIGPSVAHWFLEIASQHPALHAELIDLAEVNLPMFDEPNHPSKGIYLHEHTKRWSARIAPADAFVIVTPEYNHLPPPSLINALEYLYKEWNHKPVAFVSYGGISGGTRAVEVARQMAVALKMSPLTESLPMPFVAKQIEAGKLTGTESQAKAARTLLDALARVAEAMRTLR
jgi:NAD(P)H-dependent FMN reductase